MMKIEMLADGSVKCDNRPCNPLFLWNDRGACGDCPLIQWGEDFCNAYFEDAIFTSKVPGRVEK